MVLLVMFYGALSVGKLRKRSNNSLPARQPISATNVLIVVTILSGRNLNRVVFHGVLSVGNTRKRSKGSLLEGQPISATNALLLVVRLSGRDLHRKTSHRMLRLLPHPRRFSNN